MKLFPALLSRPAISVLAFVIFFTLSSTMVAAEEPDPTIANIPVEELPGAEDNEVPEVDEGRKCKRIRKTGSNRITRVCTTRAQREEANSASAEFLREQQMDQERYMIENANAGAPTPQ